MSRHRSFRPSDFSLRDIPGFLVGYVIICVMCVLGGLLLKPLLKPLPPFGRGMLLGLGIGFFGALFLLRKKRVVDIGSLPQPSENVRRICDDPACTFPSPLFVKAVKLYRAETNLHLTEATAVLKARVAARQRQP